MTDKQVSALLRKHMPELIRIRHYLHQHPEFKHKEFGTAALVERELRNLDIEVQRVGPTGVVGIIRGPRGGRTVGLRGDMDALEIAEQTGLPYASTNGFMHACGHDGNTTLLLGAARVLAAMRNGLRGNVKLFFQPAEEGGGAGGKMMVDAGVLERPKVDAVFGMHGFPKLPVGTIAASGGPVQASSDRLILRVLGRGGHAAAPHLTVDPIVVTARIIEGLQTIVSREQAPDAMSVVTLAGIQAGSMNTQNIIPDDVKLIGTIRSVTLEQRKEIFTAVRRIATLTARSHRARCVVKIVEGYPPTVNDHAMADLVRRVGASVLGSDNVRREELSMGGEDFSFFLLKRPGCYIRLGLDEPGSKRPMAMPHSLRYDFNDRAIPYGVRVFVAIVQAFLNERRQ